MRRQPRRQPGGTSSSFPLAALEPVAERLPSEVDGIGAYQQPRPLLRLSRVCRAWREQLGRTVLRENISLRWSDNLSASFMLWLAKNLWRVRSLTFGSDVELPPDLLTAPGPANSLTRLEFCGCTANTRLPSLATCTALQELSVNLCFRIDGLPPLEALTRLTRLEVRMNIDLKRLPPLAGCVSLRELLVSDVPRLELPPDLLSGGSNTALQALQIDTRMGPRAPAGYDRLPLPAAVANGQLTGLTSLRLAGVKVGVYLLVRLSVRHHPRQ